MGVEHFSASFCPLAKGEKQYKFDEFLPIYQSILKENAEGTFADFMEAFKTFDREGQGFITAAELRAVLTSYGERLSDEQVDEIITATQTKIDRDGNIRYEGKAERCLNV